MDVNVSPGAIVYFPVAGVGVGVGVGVGITGVGCGCGDGAGVGTLLDGIDICVPIWRALGLTFGFAASNAATVVPSFAAMELKVSQATIVYVEADCGS
jgi:hypothetical protein